MTLPYSLRRAGPFSGTGVLVAFPFTFKVFAKTDVSAQLTVNGVTTTLVQDSDYTVALNADQEATPGGDIQYVLALGATLTLLGSLPYDQPADLPAGGAYRAQVVEDALDRIVIQTQQLAESADRSLRAPIGEVLGVLPNRAARANTIQGYDSNGDPSVAAPVSGSAADVLVQLADASNPARGSALVGHLPSGTGALAETAQTIFRRTIWADSFNTLEEALVYAASLGGKGRGVRLRGGTRYTRTTKLAMGIYPGCGLYCLEGTAEIYFPSASFPNTALGDRYNATGAGISIDGETSGGFARAERQFLIGLHITSQVGDGRVFDGVQSRNTRDLRLEDLTFSGFPVGCDIRASTWDGGRIVNPRHTGRASTHLWAQQMQSTAIEFDNDRVNSTGSEGVQIVEPWGRDFTISGQTNSAWDDQTDFISIAHQTTAGFSITSPNAANFGEGLDIFGKSHNVSNPTLAQMKTYAIKFVHGARFNTVTGGGAEDVGKGGVVFAGSDVWLDDPTNTIPAGDTERNTVTGFSVTGVDYQNRFSGGEGCVSVVDNVGTTGKPRNNVVIGGRHSLGTYGKYGWHDQSTGSGNVGKDFDVALSTVSGAKHALIVNSGGAVFPATTPASRAFMGVAQNIPAAVDHLLLMNSSSFDRRGELQVATATVTISNASPGVLTYTGSDIFADGDPVILTTTGGLPTGLAVETTYFVRDLNTTTNTFSLAATAGGSAINTSSAGSGVHTCNPGGIWVCQFPGLYRVHAQVRFATVGAAAVLVNMKIKKNGGTDATIKQQASAAASDQTFDVDDVISCVAGDRVVVFINQASGSTRTATALTAHTFMTVGVA